MALIKLEGPAKFKFKTGVMVLYSDDVSFTLMTPEGHMFAGWITFSAHEEEGATVAQTQVLMRAQDPLAEIGLTMGGHGKENKFWEATMREPGLEPRRRDPDGGDDDGLRRREASVVARDQRPPLGGDPVDAALAQAGEGGAAAGVSGASTASATSSAG